MLRDPTYQRSLKSALRELDRLTTEHEKLAIRSEQVTSRIFTFKRIVSGLAGLLEVDPAADYPQLFPDSINPDTAFTAAVHRVLQSSKIYLTCLDIHQALTASEFNLGDYQHPLSLIQAIVNQLLQSGQGEGLRFGQEILYRWKRGAQAAEDKRLRERLALRLIKSSGQ